MYINLSSLFILSENKVVEFNDSFLIFPSGLSIKSISISECVYICVCVKKNYLIIWPVYI